MQLQRHGHVALGERGLLEHRAAGEAGDRGALVDLDPRVGVDPVDEVRAHGRGQRSSDGDAHRGGVLGEEHGGLPGGVATTDDEHRDPGARPGFELRGGVVDARHLVPVEIGDGELAVVGAGGGDDRAPGHLRAVGEGERVVPGDEVEPGDGARGGDDGTELLGLERGSGGEVLTGDAGGEAEVVLDARARGCLSTDRRTVQGERPEALRRGVHGGGQPRRAGADHHDVVAALRDGLEGEAELDGDVAGCGPPEHPRAGDDDG